MRAGDRYWDSSVFIAYFEEEEGRFEWCEAVIEAAQRGDARIITSTISFCEVIYINGRDLMNEEIEERLKAFFELPFIVPVVLERAVAEDARELIWRHRHLKPKDAIHVSSARHAGVNVIDAYDGDFLKLNGTITGFDGAPIRIGHPDLPAAPRLSSDW